MLRATLAFQARWRYRRLRKAVLGIQTQYRKMEAQRQHKEKIDKNKNEHEEREKEQSEKEAREAEEEDGQGRVEEGAMERMRPPTLSLEELAQIFARRDHNLRYFKKPSFFSSPSKQLKKAQNFATCKEDCQDEGRKIEKPPPAPKQPEFTVEPQTQVT